MILTKEQIQRLSEASEPLIKWINEENFNPHVKIIVDNASAEFFEGSARVIIDKHLRD